MAVPFAWGETPQLRGDRLLYTRQDLISPSPQLRPGREMALFDFSSQIEYAPIFRNTAMTTHYSDISVGMSGDWLFWVRLYPSSTEVHLANVYPPYQHTVLDLANHVLNGTQAAIISVKGGNEFNSANPNDFVLSWVKTTQLPSNPNGLQRTLQWCRLADCVALNIQSGLPPLPGQTLPGTQAGEEVTEALLSLAGGSGNGNPSAVYRVEGNANASHFTSWETTMGGGHASIVTAWSGLGGTVTEMDWSGVHSGFTHETGLGQTAVSLSLPVLPFPAALFTSTPGGVESDAQIAIARTASAQGDVLFAFTRFAANGSAASASDQSEVRAAFAGSAGVSQDIPVPVMPSPWSACSEPSVDGNRVVMTCRDPSDPRLIPILFYSICTP